jgi:hypothetical protein
MPATGVDQNPSKDQRRAEAPSLADAPDVRERRANQSLVGQSDGGRRREQLDFFLGTKSPCVGHAPNLSDVHAVLAIERNPEARKFELKIPHLLRAARHRSIEAGEASSFSGRRGADCGRRTFLDIRFQEIVKLLALAWTKRHLACEETDFIVIETHFEKVPIVCC